MDNTQSMNTSRLPLKTDKLIDLCRQNDVAMLGVFGSTSRGEATEQSDIDLLVRFSKSKSLFAHADLAIQIEALLGRRVDLLTEAAISPYIRDQVKQDLQVLYEA